MPRVPARGPIRPGRRRRLVISAVALPVALTVTACTVANSSDAAGGDILRIVLPEEPPTLEPCEASLTSTGSVVRSNITEPLMERDASSGELEPKLATRWERTSDRRWTFEVRKGVKFSDGTPFDAKDAAYSIDRAVNSDLGCNVEGYVFGDMDLEVAAPDAGTLTVTTPEADPIFPMRLSFVEMVPTSTSADKKVREPVGTGPYRIEHWQPGLRLVLAANKRYWGDRPAYPTAEYQWRTEGSVRAAMVVGGEADIATAIGPEDGAADAALQFPNNETTALRMQAYEPPLDDKRVRQAINYAIDRKSIVDGLYQGDARAAAQLVPKGIVGFNPELKPWPTDLRKARDLLAEAEADGVDLDAQIRLITRTALFPKVEETVQVIQNQLSELGLNVKIEMKDTAGSTEVQERPFPEDSGPYLLLIQHGNQAGDAAFSMDQYLLSDGFQSSWGTAAFDRKIRAAEELEGRERQDALARIFEEEPDEIAQYAYIAHMNGIIAVAPTVRYRPNSSTGDEMRLAEISPADD
ncbi:ABC transporter substrate-binding protein [Streptomyces sp. WMMC500]|uniref:ABC transporter substrate-binding protein n=1 Tax=Streptomyces sp. WMMC500 TaxID=3015154 RepID=UPI00248B5FE9|nr:ABC transporter substrate-binding protein [Streptomyces sp. WMMC500]WBB62591.1 ABC transporter substrate-binding protein [Streptomyces sp. WMMC500]